MSLVCNICVEPFTQLKRKKVVCGKCAYECCRECLKRYFLAKNELSPRCISGCCDHRYKYSELVRNLPKVFVKTFVGDVLFEEESRRFDDFVFNSHYENRKKVEGQKLYELKECFIGVDYKRIKLSRKIVLLQNIGDTHCRICAQEYNGGKRRMLECDECEYKCCLECVGKHYYLYGKPKCVRKECYCIFTNPYIQYNPYIPSYLIPTSNVCTSLFEEDVRFKEHVERTMSSLKEMRVIVREELEMMSNEIRQRRIRIEEIEREQENKYGTLCADPGCPGLCFPESAGSSFSTCAVCSETYCTECETKVSCAQSHECDQNTIENIRSIKSETRACPSCKKPIFKISGCDQMFCTMCFVKFDWQTGNILGTRTAFHNIHFANRVNSIRNEDNNRIYTTFFNKTETDPAWNSNPDNELYLKVFNRLIHDILPNMDINLININSEWVVSGRELMSDYVESRTSEGVYKKVLFKFYDLKKRQEEIHDHFLKLTLDMLGSMGNFNESRLGGGEDVSLCLYKNLKGFVAEVEGSGNINEVHWYKRVLRRFEDK